MLALLQLNSNLSAKELQGKQSKLDEQEELPNVMQQVSGGVENRTVGNGYPYDDRQLVKPPCNQVHTIIIQFKDTWEEYLGNPILSLAQIIQHMNRKEKKRNTWKIKGDRNSDHDSHHLL